MDSLPTEMQNSLQDAFAELPLRVLWKYDGDVMENQPRNVMIKKWFPQRDILGVVNNIFLMDIHTRHTILSFLCVC